MIEFIKTNYLYFVVGISSIIVWDILQWIFRKSFKKINEKVFGPCGRYLKKFRTLKTLLWLMLILIIGLVALVILLYIKTKG